jgi:hypothetical protein
MRTALESVKKASDELELFGVSLRRGLSPKIATGFIFGMA